VHRSRGGGRRALIALLTAWAGACSDSQAPVAGGRLALAPPWTSLVVGDTVSPVTSVQAYFIDTAGDTATLGAVTWSSTNPGVLQVNAAGIVRGVSPGTAILRGTAGGVTAEQPMIVTPPVLVGAGDIGGCQSVRDEDTGRLLDSIAGVVITLGDNDYSDATPTPAYGACYPSSWARHLPRTRPAPGEDDLRNGTLADYYAFFGPAAAGPLGYYSYDLGTWHIVVLNTTPTADTAQLRWLEDDLSDHPALCTLAIAHRPRFSSGNTGSSGAQGAVFQALYNGGVEILLSGNDHDYERFAPQSPNQSPDPGGVVQFVVGTGGKSHGTINVPLVPNSLVQNDDTYGVLQLVLHPGSYDWTFHPIPGQTFTDAGSATCH
jgi:hypothetical protein